MSRYLRWILRGRCSRRFLIGVLASVLIPSSSVIAEEVKGLKGATIYLPVYSHVYYGDQLRPFNLAVTISLRNPNFKKGAKVQKVDYYNSYGQLVRKLLPNETSLGALKTLNLKIRESDVEGGSGASVIIEWSSDEEMVPLLAESIMIGTAQGQGISFLSRGENMAVVP